MLGFGQILFTFLDYSSSSIAINFEGVSQISFDSGNGYFSNPTYISQPLSSSI